MWSCFSTLQTLPPVIQNDLLITPSPPKDHAIFVWVFDVNIRIYDNQFYYWLTITNQEKRENFKSMFFTLICYMKPHNCDLLVTPPPPPIKGSHNFWTVPYCETIYWFNIWYCIKLQRKRLNQIYTDFDKCFANIYQPTGTGGTRSPPATLHRLQNGY